jgi:predicted acetyltransferase
MMGDEKQEHREALTEFSKLVEKWKERGISHFLLIGNKDIGFAFISDLAFKEEDHAAGFLEYYARAMFKARGSPNDKPLDEMQKDWNNG